MSSTIANTATSSSNGRLRRSARAPKKVIAEFSVGDVVEIQRGTGTMQARLVQLLTEGTVSPNPRWLIRYIINSKDEEVYEHSFLGKVGMNRDDVPIGQAEEQNANGDESPKLSDQQQLNEAATDTSTARASKKKKTEHTNGIDSTANSDSSVGRKSATRTKPVPAASKPSNKDNAVSASSRESRSRRRGGGGQPLLDKIFDGEQQDEAVHTDERLSQNIGGETNQLQRKRKLTGAAKTSVETKRERELKVTKKTQGNTSSTVAANQSTAKQEKKEEEECVKIKFLTGTLYLYRGKRRRAEFVRRV